MQRNGAGKNLEVEARCNMAMVEVFPNIKVLLGG
jgi:hypothetical protein